MSSRLLSSMKNPSLRRLKGTGLAWGFEFFKRLLDSLSDGYGGVWHPDDVTTKAVDGLGVNVVDPLVGRLPDDDPDPEREVGRHEVDEPEPSKQAKPLDNHGGVDKQKVHLQEGEQSLTFNLI